MNKTNNFIKKYRNVYSFIIVCYFFMTIQLVQGEEMVNLDGKYTQFFYELSDTLGEKDLKNQLEILNKQNIKPIVLIDATKYYPKRIIYLIGTALKNTDYKVAISNTPKVDSVFFQKGYYKLLTINYIYEIEENQTLTLYVFNNTITFHKIFIDKEIAVMFDHLQADENKGFVIHSANFYTAGILFIKDYDQNTFLNKIDENISVKPYIKPSSLIWFNKIGLIVMIIFSISLIFFSISLFVFRRWSFKRLTKTGVK